MMEAKLICLSAPPSLNSIASTEKPTPYTREKMHMDSKKKSYLATLLVRMSVSTIELARVTTKLVLSKTQICTVCIVPSL